MLSRARVLADRVLTRLRQGGFTNLVDSEVQVDGSIIVVHAMMMGDAPIVKTEIFAPDPSMLIPAAPLATPMYVSAIAQEADVSGEYGYYTTVRLVVGTDEDENPNLSIARYSDTYGFTSRKAYILGYNEYEARDATLYGWVSKNKKVAIAWNAHEVFFDSLCVAKFWELNMEEIPSGWDLPTKPTGEPYAELLYSRVIGASAFIHNGNSRRPGVKAHVAVIQAPQDTTFDIYEVNVFTGEKKIIRTLPIPEGAAGMLFLNPRSTTNPDLLSVKNVAGFLRFSPDRTKLLWFQPLSLYAYGTYDGTSNGRCWSLVLPEDSDEDADASWTVVSNTPLVINYGPRLGDSEGAGVIVHDARFDDDNNVVVYSVPYSGAKAASSEETVTGSDGPGWSCNLLEGERSDPVAGRYLATNQGLFSMSCYWAEYDPLPPEYDPSKAVYVGPYGASPNFNHLVNVGGQLVYTEEQYDAAVIATYGERDPYVTGVTWTKTIATTSSEVETLSLGGYSVLAKNHSTHSSTTSNSTGNTFESDPVAHHELVSDAPIEYDGHRFDGIAKIRGLVSTRGVVNVEHEWSSTPTVITDTKEAHRASFPYSQYGIPLSLLAPGTMEVGGPEDPYPDVSTPKLPPVLPFSPEGDDGPQFNYSWTGMINAALDAYGTSSMAFASGGAVVVEANFRRWLFTNYGGFDGLLTRGYTYIIKEDEAFRVVLPDNVILSDLITFTALYIGGVRRRPHAAQ
jgi:hypothetical protein